MRENRSVWSSWGKRVVAVCAVAAFPLASVSTAADAITAPTAVAVSPAGTGASIESVATLGPQRVILQVRSPAMNKVIPVQLLLPKDFAARPTATWPSYYMLDGVRSPLGKSNWTEIADTAQFFARKNALVVQSTGADASFFADWRRPDPKGGVLKWETFLTSELPDVLEHSSQWRASGARAISGLSMGAYGAVSLAARHPGFYAAVASFSGYPHSTLPGVPQVINNTVASSSNFNPDNMYGDPSTPLWAESDAYNYPEAFRGVQVFVSAGTGFPNFGEFFGAFLDSFRGIILEVVSNYSSSGFVQLLRQQGISVDSDLSYQGIHAWPYWNVEYKKSWPTVARGLGLPPGDS